MRTPNNTLFIIALILSSLTCSLSLRTSKNTEAATANPYHHFAEESAEDNFAEESAEDKKDGLFGVNLGKGESNTRIMARNTRNLSKTCKLYRLKNWQAIFQHNNRNWYRFDLRNLFSVDKDGRVYPMEKEDKASDFTAIDKSCHDLNIKGEDEIITLKCKDQLGSFSNNEINLNSWLRFNNKGMMYGLKAK